MLVLLHMVIFEADVTSGVGLTLTVIVATEAAVHDPFAAVEVGITV